jgi:uncharacterized protein
MTAARRMRLARVAPARDTVRRMQVLILHGWPGSVDAAAKRAIYADHWQTWLARRLADAGVDVRYPTLPDPDSPRPEAWDAALADQVAALDPETERVVVCHSLACVAWLRMAPQTRDPIADRVLLVAPPSPDTDIPEVAVFFPVALDPAAVENAAAHTRIVCSDDDPFCPEGAATSLGAPLAIPVDLVPNGGHLNPEAGYGPWPAIEAWVRGEAARVTA